MVLLLWTFIFVMPLGAFAGFDPVATTALSLHEWMEKKDCSQFSDQDLRSLKNSGLPCFKTSSSPTIESREIAETAFFNHAANEQLKQLSCKLSSIDFFKANQDSVKLRGKDLASKLPALREAYAAADKASAESSKAYGKMNQACAGSGRNGVSKNCSETLRAYTELRTLSEQANAKYMTMAASIWNGNTRTMMKVLKKLSSSNEPIDEYKAAQIIFNNIQEVRKEFSEASDSLKSFRKEVNGSEDFSALSAEVKANFVRRQFLVEQLSEQKNDSAAKKFQCYLEGKYTKGKDKLNVATTLSSLLLGFGAGLLIRAPIGIYEGASQLALNARQVGVVLGSVPVGMDFLNQSGNAINSCLLKQVDIEVSGACPNTTESSHQEEVRQIEVGSCLWEGGLFLVAAAPNFMSGSIIRAALPTKLARPVAYRWMTFKEGNTVFPHVNVTKDDLASVVSKLSLNPAGKVESSIDTNYRIFDSISHMMSLRHDYGAGKVINYSAEARKLGMTEQEMMAAVKGSSRAFDKIVSEQIVNDRLAAFKALGPNPTRNPKYKSYLMFPDFPLLNYDSKLAFIEKGLNRKLSFSEKQFLINYGIHPQSIGDWTGKIDPKLVGSEYYSEPKKFLRALESIFFDEADRKFLLESGIVRDMSGVGEMRLNVRQVLLDPTKKFTPEEFENLKKELVNIGEGASTHMLVGATENTADLVHHYSAHTEARLSASHISAALHEEVMTAAAAVKVEAAEVRALKEVVGPAIRDVQDMSPSGLRRWADLNKRNCFSAERIFGTIKDSCVALFKMACKVANTSCVKFEKGARWDGKLDSAEKEVLQKNWDSTVAHLQESVKKRSLELTEEIKTSQINSVMDLSSKIYKKEMQLKAASPEQVPLLERELAALKASAQEKGVTPIAMDDARLLLWERRSKSTTSWPNEALNDFLERPDIFNRCQAGVCQTVPKKGWKKLEKSSSSQATEWEVEHKYKGKKYKVTVFICAKPSCIVEDKVVKEGEILTLFPRCGPDVRELPMVSQWLKSSEEAAVKPMPCRK